MNTKCDPVSDIFSAGIIFHHLLFGCSIFEGKKYNEVLAQNRLCELNFNREIYSKIDPSAFNLLSKMLEKDSKKRISADSALNHPFFMGDMDIEI
jgi:serine/threonine protein kinase